MLNWIDVMMKQEQYEDLLRDAEHSALVHEALMDRKRRAPIDWRMLAARMLAALVRRLINRGCNLLARCASALKVPVQTPCQDAGARQN